MVVYKTVFAFFSALLLVSCAVASNDKSTTAPTPKTENAPVPQKTQPMTQKANYQLYKNVGNAHIYSSVNKLIEESNKRFATFKDSETLEFKNSAAFKDIEKQHGELIASLEWVQSLQPKTEVSQQINYFNRIKAALPEANKKNIAIGTGVVATTGVIVYGAVKAYKSYTKPAKQTGWFK